MRTSEPKKSSDDKQPLTVYFDGSCPLCSREINWYKKRPGGEEIFWHDVSSVKDENLTDDLKTTDALNRLHVRKSDGTLVSGAGAFSELWLNIPSLKIAGAITRLPVIRTVAEFFYKVFLSFRKKR